MKSTGIRWQTPGWTLAAGTVVLFVGLMTGPTPGDDTAGALRVIDEHRVRYVLTNMLDMAGALVMLLGFVQVARIQLAGISSRLTAAAGATASILGCALFQLVLVLQTAVDPALARRFVQSADGGDKRQYLAIADSVFDLETGLFGLTLLLILWGVAAIGLCAWRDGAPRMAEWFLVAGIAISLVAGLTAPAFAFESTKAFGRLEPVLSILALLWLTAFGVIAARQASATDGP